MKEENKLKILIVVDIQNDFITGSLGTPEARAIVPKIATLPENYDWTFYTRDTHDEYYYNDYHSEGINGIPPHCIEDTNGWELVDRLKSVKNVYKNSCYVNKSDFGFPYWKDKINGLWTIFVDEMPVKTQIDICGVCTDICVITNALALRSIFPDDKIRVLSDCCAGSTPEMHQKALDVMRNCLIEIV
jgi:nicotinamidase-related amidase